MLMSLGTKVEEGQPVGLHKVRQSKYIHDMVDCSNDSAWRTASRRMLPPLAILIPKRHLHCAPTTCQHIETCSLRMMRIALEHMNHNIHQMARAVKVK